MKKLFTLLLIIEYSLNSFSQIKAKTEDGKIVELNIDGTWKFIGTQNSTTPKQLTNTEVNTNPTTNILTETKPNTGELGIPEPEFTGMVEFVDKEGKKNIPLESARTNQKGGAGAGKILTGIGKIKIKLSVEGKTSTLALKKTHVLQFIARNETNSANPQKVIQLIKFDQTGKRRQVEIASVGAFGGTSSGLEGYMDFQAKKYGNSSYLVSVIDLAPGEYGFSIGESNATIMYMFTVEE